MHVSYGSHAKRLSMAAFAVLLFLMLPLTAHASDVRYLWQSRDQFVALERQESAPAGALHPNDHPVEIALDRITAILESIRLRAADGGKTEDLLTGPAVETLAPRIRQALQQATPLDDVTFAVIGLHSTLYGLAKSPKVTTGRVFYQAGRLNIIFGLVQQEVRERDDRRLFPFTPGSRHKLASGQWTLLTETAPVRRDWLAFDATWQATPHQPPVVEQKPVQIRTMPAQPERRSRDTRGAAERLITLKELKDKGLISEEEYQAKRLEILNNL